MAKCAFRLLFVTSITVAMTTSALQCALAQDKPNTAPSNAAPEDEDPPTPTPLAVGALQIASDAGLTIDAIDVTVGTDQIVYAYRFGNKGNGTLALSASIAMPDLERSDDESESYSLPATAADNPVGLTVISNGKQVATATQVETGALGINRLADLQAERMPLVPFAAETEKAIAAASPDSLAKLARLGLLSPRDPAQPTTPPVADWVLHVTHQWTQVLPPNAKTDVSISFTPVKASYALDKDALAGLDELKNQICLTPKMSAALKALVKAKGATLEVADLLLAGDKPTRWVESPAMTIGVRKPKPASLIAFCGQDAASTGAPIVKGRVTDDGVRIMIFTPVTP